MDEAEASLIREELSLRWKRIQFLEAENAKLKERGVKHHAEAAKFLATQAALKEQVKILKAENAKLKAEAKDYQLAMAAAKPANAAFEAENARLKEENDHLDNVIQGLHHDLDVLRKLVEI